MNTKQIQRKLKQASELNQKGQFKRARLACKEVISKHKDLALAWKLLATNELRLQEWKEAEIAIKNCISLGDNDLIAYRLLATCYLESNQLGNAQKLLEDLYHQTKEQSLLPDIALNLHRMGEFKQSLEIYDGFLSIAPDHDKAAYNRTILALSLGARDDIWLDYRLRHKQTNASTIPSEIAPLWQGQSLMGKRILIWSEQGIADQIIFSRFFESVSKNAESVTVNCTQRLLLLFKNSFPQISFTAVQDDDYQALLEGKFDYQVYAGELPYITKTDTNNYPTNLVATNHCADKAVRDHQHSKINIGISWFSGNSSTNANNRWSLPDEALTELLSHKAVNWYSLQHGDYKTQQKQLQQRNISIIDVPNCSANGDFASYVSLINQMDFVISIDNTAAITAAALGKEVWVLHPADPFWVWGVGTSNQWYNSSKHFIKPWDTSWQNFISETVQPILLKRLGC